MKLNEIAEPKTSKPSPEAQIRDLVRTADALAFKTEFQNEQAVKLLKKLNLVGGTTPPSSEYVSIVQDATPGAYLSYMLDTPENRELLKRFREKHNSSEAAGLQHKKITEKIKRIRRAMRQD
jgi:hypothetical protein